MRALGTKLQDWHVHPPLEVSMKAHIRRWGNSAAIQIPASVMQGVGFSLNQVVEIRADGGRIVIEAVDRPAYDLDQLLGQMTADTFHEAADFGRSVGREAW